MTDGEDPTDEDEGRVLAPEELDISDDEHVAEIDDGRFVVSPNDPIDEVAVPQDEPEPAEVESASSSDSASEPESPPSEDPLNRSPAQAQGDRDSIATQLDETDVERWLEQSFRDADSRYGFHVTASFDGRISQRRMMSNDVVTIFESLILWYAQHIDSETPVEEILGILLTESNVPITYPTESLSKAIKSGGLGPDDTIGELIETMGEDGFEL